MKAEGIIALFPDYSHYCNRIGSGQEPLRRFFICVDLVSNAPTALVQREGAPKHPSVPRLRLNELGA